MVSPRRFYRGQRVWHAGREPYKNLGVSQTLLQEQVGVSKRKAGASKEDGNSDRFIVLRGRESRPQGKTKLWYIGEGAGNKSYSSKETCTALEVEKYMQTSLREIAIQAKQNKEYRFINLHHIIDAEFLVDSFKRLNKKSATGVDGVSTREYGENLYFNVKNTGGA